MKAHAKDKIKLIKDVTYGTSYGLTEIKKGTELTVSNRNVSDDGIVTVETITLTNELGTKTSEFHIWDTDYVLV